MFGYCLGGVSCPEIGLHIICKPMDQKRKVQIIYDREVNHLSYRTLGKKYGINHTSIFQMLKAKQTKAAAVKAPMPEEADETASPGELKALKAELRKAKLKIELLESVITISSKELGIDLRKKRGARRS